MDMYIQLTHANQEHHRLQYQYNQEENTEILFKPYIIRKEKSFFLSIKLFILSFIADCINISITKANLRGGTLWEGIYQRLDHIFSGGTVTPHPPLPWASSE